MANDYFRFKQFEVIHQQCAMKVNTDGCLLGAWATAEQPSKILDIGTGSGVIALMLAQKYNAATVDALEIEENCANQCKVNFKLSPFSERLETHPIALQKFCTDNYYDLIVSNPPYFANDLKNNDAQKTVARHQTSLKTEDLFLNVSRLLTPKGVFCEIIPTQILNQVLNCAHQNKLFLQKQVAVRALPHKPIGRYLLQFGFDEIMPLRKSEMCVYDAEKQYSAYFTALLKPYYLNL